MDGVDITLNSPSVCRSVKSYPFVKEWLCGSEKLTAYEPAGGILLLRITTSIIILGFFTNFENHEVGNVELMAVRPALYPETYLQSHFNF